MSTVEKGRARKRGRRGSRQTTPSGVVPPDSTDGGTPLHAGVRAAEDEVDKAGSVSADDRRQLASEGKALPDGSYPIPDAEHLRSAVRLAVSGHGDVKAARKLIERRAHELGRPDLLPSDWGAAKAADGRPGPMTADEFAAHLDAVRKGTQRQVAYGHPCEDPATDPHDGALVAFRQGNRVTHLDQRGREVRQTTVVQQAIGDHQESSAYCTPGMAKVEHVDYSGPASPTMAGQLAHPINPSPVQQPGANPNSSSVQPRDLGSLSGDGVGGAPVAQTGSQIMPAVNGRVTAPMDRAPYVANPRSATGRAPGE